MNLSVEINLTRTKLPALKDVSGESAMKRNADFRSVILFCVILSQNTYRCDCVDV